MSDGQAPISQSQLKCINCGYNLTGVALGTNCPECGTPVEASLQSFGRGERRSGSRLPQVSMVGPILITLFCCQIGGILAIVYTSQANTAAARGDRFDYERHRKTANMWTTLSLVLGIAIGVLYFIAIMASEY